MSLKKLSSNEPSRADSKQAQVLAMPQRIDIQFVPWRVGQEPQHGLRQHEDRSGRPGLRHISADILHRKRRLIAWKGSVELRQLVQQEMTRSGSSWCRHVRHNLSKWANKFGFHRIPAWLRSPKADQLVFRWSLATMVFLIFIGLGLGYMFLSPAPTCRQYRLQMRRYREN